MYKRQVYPRLIGRTHTNSHILLYETIIIIGGILGNISDIYEIPFHIPGQWLSNAFLLVCGCLLYTSSHTEAFVFYVLSQKKELWASQAGMFDLAEGSLRYYEMKVQRGMKRNMVMAEYEKLEEGFNLSILDNEQGGKMADKILCSFGRKFLDKKLFSSIFLAGKGFEQIRCV